VTVLPITNTLIDVPLLRLSVPPRKTSQVMIDKLSTVSRSKIGSTFGIAGDTVMLSVNRAVVLFLGLA